MSGNRWLFRLMIITCMSCARPFRPRTPPPPLNRNNLLSCVVLVLFSQDEDKADDFIAAGQKAPRPLPKKANQD